MELTDLFSGSNATILALLLTPVIGAILVTIVKQKRISEIVTVSSAFLILIQVFFIVSKIISEKTITAFGNTFYIDSFGAIILLPISIVGFVSAMYSVNYMGRQYDNGMIDMKHVTRYYQGLNVFLLTMLIVPIANNMGIMWVTVEDYHTCLCSFDNVIFQTKCYRIGMEVPDNCNGRIIFCLDRHNIFLLCKYQCGKFSRSNELDWYVA